MHIPANAGTVVLTGSSYGNVFIGDNTTVVFSGQPTVYANQVRMDAGASLEFAQDTRLLLAGSLSMDERGRVERAGHHVWINAGGDVQIGAGSTANANVHTLGRLFARRATAERPTDLTGLFLADEVKSEAFVRWNWDAEQCPLAAPVSFARPPVAAIAAWEEPAAASVVLYPNPATDRVSVERMDLRGRRATVRVYDLRGRLVRDLHLDAAPSDVIGVDLAGVLPGVYLLQLAADGLPEESRRLVVLR